MRRELPSERGGVVLPALKDQPAARVGSHRLADLGRELPEVLVGGALVPDEVAEFSLLRSSTRSASCCRSGSITISRGASLLPPILRRIEWRRDQASLEQMRMLLEARRSEPARVDTC
jgi:hypothetical protein